MGWEMWRHLDASIGDKSTCMMKWMEGPESPFPQMKPCGLGGRTLKNLTFLAIRNGGLVSRSLIMDRPFDIAKLPPFSQTAFSVLEAKNLLHAAQEISIAESVPAVF